MKKTKIAITTICLLWAAIATVPTSEAATTYAGAIVVGIDEAQPTITFQKEDGRTWTLPVTDSNILKQKQIAKGDRVRIEVELNDSDFSQRITKITKIPDQSLPEPTKSLDEVKP